MTKEPVGDSTLTANYQFSKSFDFRFHALRYGFEVLSGQNAMIWTFWNDRYEIIKGMALLPNDAASQILLHYAIEELTQCLGIPGDSNLYQDSVFCEV